MEKHYTQKPKEGSNSSVHHWTNSHANWSIHAMEWYSASKREEILTHATARMALQDIMLGKISHAPKTANVVMIPLLGGSYKCRRIVVAWGWGTGGSGVQLKGDRVSVQEDGNSVVVRDCTTR